MPGAPNETRAMSRIRFRTRFDAGHQRRDARLLEAEERPRQQQREAVEHEADRERDQRPADVHGGRRGEAAMLVEQLHDRLGQRDRDGRGRQQQEDDRAAAVGDRAREAGDVAAGSQPRDLGEQHLRDGDREQALRQHEQAEGEVEVGHRVAGGVGGDQQVDRQVDVDQPQAQRHGHHQPQDPAHLGVAEPEVEGQALAAAAQQRQRDQELDDRRQQHADRVDGRPVVGRGDGGGVAERGDDDAVPGDRRQRRARRTPRRS